MEHLDEIGEGPVARTGKRGLLPEAAGGRRLIGNYRNGVPHFAYLSARNKAAYAALHGYKFLLVEKMFGRDVSLSAPHSAPPSSRKHVPLRSWFPARNRLGQGEGYARVT